MGKIFVDLRVHADVATMTDVVDYYVPPTGSLVAIKKFWGSGAGLPNAAICLLWDYGEAGEEIIGSIKMEGDAPNNSIRIIETTETDNAKKIALCATNSEAGSLLLSGYVRLQVITT